jgi:hypothetical protein
MDALPHVVAPGDIADAYPALREVTLDARRLP